MTPLIGHNGPSDADRIADYIEDRARRYRDRAARMGNPDLLTRATTADAVASDVRARLYED